MNDMINMVLPLFGGTGSLMVSWWLHNKYPSFLAYMQDRDKLKTNDIPTEAIEILKQISKTTGVDYKFLIHTANLSKNAMNYDRTVTGSFKFEIGKLHYDYSNTRAYTLIYHDGRGMVKVERMVTGAIKVTRK